MDHDHDIAVVHGVYNININQLITHGPGSACRQWNLAKMMDGHESIDIHGWKYFLQRIPTLAWMTYIKLIQVTSTSRYHWKSANNPMNSPNVSWFNQHVPLFSYGSGAFLYPRLMGRSCPSSRRLPTSWMFRNPQALLVVSQLTWTISLWLFNIAMENGPFIDDFPINTSIYKGFSMAMLNNQMGGR